MRRAVLLTVLSTGRALPRTICMWGPLVVMLPWRSTPCFVFMHEALLSARRRDFWAIVEARYSTKRSAGILEKNVPCVRTFVCGLTDLVLHSEDLQ